MMKESNSRRYILSLVKWGNYYADEFIEDIEKPFPKYDQRGDITEIYTDIEKLLASRRK